MFVLMRETLATANGPVATAYEQGQIYEVMDAMGANWIRNGLAEPSDMPPQFITDYFARLDVGAGQTCVFLPFVGEFGHLIMSHVRMVHWHKAARKVVCCRPDQRVLFPSADEFYHEWEDPTPDAEKCGTSNGRTYEWPAIEAEYPDAVPIAAGGLTRSQEIIAIEPAQRIPFQPRRRGMRVDVCLGVRNRKFASHKNWTHWQAVADALTAAGYTIAVIGAKATANDLHGQTFHSGNFDTDAGIELLQNCRLYIGSDSGNSHLAATVGAKMLLISACSAPGSTDRDYTPRMEAVNEGRIQVIQAGWSDPQAVIKAALAELGKGRGKRAKQK